MSFMRAASGVLLLAIGIPILLAGGTLWMVAEQRDAGGAFGGTVERLETAGHAVVVPDLDALLRRDAPFARAGRTRLRITARTPDGPAFLGVGPATDIADYLASAPYARVERVSVTRGVLPVRAVAAVPEHPGGTLAAPDTRTFWRRSGVGVLDIDARRLRGEAWSLVVMRPDGAASVGVDLRAEVRIGWLDPAAWGLLAGGVLLVLLSVGVLVRPVRPREVVFVVRPDQVPVLAARLGVETLDPADRAGRAVPASPPSAGRPGVASTGAAPAWELLGPPRASAGRREADRPADLTELLDAEQREVTEGAGGRRSDWRRVDGRRAEGRRAEGRRADGEQPEPARRAVGWSLPTPPAWPPSRTERPAAPRTERPAALIRPSAPARPSAARNERSAARNERSAVVAPPPPVVAPSSSRSGPPVE